MENERRDREKEIQKANKEVLAVLKEEFGEGGQVRSMENSVIRTSLKGIKDRHREQVIQLFCGFAMVPEDTHCPLEVLAMIFEVTRPLAASNRRGSSALVSDAGANASGEQPRPTSKLMIRKWLKMLIDRSLVLGSVDKPQLCVPPSLCLLVFARRWQVLTWFAGLDVLPLWNEANSWMISYQTLC